MIQGRFSWAIAAFSVTLCLYIANSALAVSVYDDAVSYWSFDSGTVTASETAVSVSDQTANGYNLAGSGPIANISTITGPVGEAMKTTSGACFTGGDVSALNVNRDDAFTVAGWIKLTDKNVAPLASKMESSNNYRGWWVLSNSNQSVDFLLRSTNSPLNAVWYGSTTRLDIKNWHHVVATYGYEASNATCGVRIYIDGKETKLESKSSNQLPGDPAPTTTSPASFNLLGRDDSAISGASVDEIATWNRVLSATEVSTLYSQASSLLATRGLNYFTNGDFEANSPNWTAAGSDDPAVPTDWATHSTRTCAAAPVTGSAAIDGTTSAFFTPGAGTELRAYLDTSLSQWQFDADFVAEDDGTDSASLAGYLVTENGGQIKFRVMPTVNSDNGRAGLWIYGADYSELGYTQDGETNNWVAITGLENAVILDDDLSGDLAVNHLTVSGNFLADDAPYYSLSLTNALGESYTSDQYSLFINRSPDFNDGGLRELVLNCGTADYTIDNISLFDSRYMETSEVPEPSTIALLLAGIASVWLLRRR